MAISPQPSWEREHHRLVWSFDIARPGTPNITEVQIDAKTGQFVSVKQETVKDQAAEAAADRKCINHRAGFQQSARLRLALQLVE